LTRAQRRSRGFFTVDVITGLILVAALAAALAVAAGRQRRAITRLADSRAALHFAERAIASLQTGAALPDPGADEKIVVESLTDEAPAGQRWVRVTATVRERSFDLVGLVPREAGR